MKKGIFFIFLCFFLCIKADETLKNFVKEHKPTNCQLTALLSGTCGYVSCGLAMGLQSGTMTQACTAYCCCVCCIIAVPSCVYAYREHKHMLHTEQPRKQ